MDRLEATRLRRKKVVLAGAAPACQSHWKTEVKQYADVVAFRSTHRWNAAFDLRNADLE